MTTEERVNQLKSAGFAPVCSDLPIYRLSNKDGTKQLDVVVIEGRDDFFINRTENGKREDLGFFPFLTISILINSMGLKSEVKQ